MTNQKTLEELKTLKELLSAKEKDLKLHSKWADWDKAEIASLTRSIEQLDAELENEANV